MKHTMVWVVGLLAIGIFATDAAAQSDETQRILRDLSREDLAFARDQAELKVARWAPAASGMYKALSELKIERFRIQPAAWANRQDHVQQPFPRFSIVLTLGVPPSKDAPTTKEAFFHTGSFAESLAIMQDLKSSKVKAVWMERLEVKGNGSTEWWWEIRGLEY